MFLIRIQIKYRLIVFVLNLDFYYYFYLTANNLWHFDTFNNKTRKVASDAKLNSDINLTYRTIF